MNSPKLFLTLLSFFALTLTVSAQQKLDEMIERDLASWVAVYKMIHAAPELSHREEKTSAFVAKELRALGFTVTERIGKYTRPEWTGYGLVAVMKNGDGPTVMVRADMDALPVEEKTGLPYASKVRAKNDAGQEVGVMHACGHDVHTTALLGTAKMLTQMKSEWRGTLVLLGQPAEETVDGARAMLADGLYNRIPKPDYILALHVNPGLAAGTVGVAPGYALASVNSVDITVRGVGGHGSRPEDAKDPIVVAAQLILALQTIVSRERSPFDPAVVTIGSVRGGTRYNIIPDEVHLQLTVRTYKEEVRQKILASIERITRHVALAAGIPEDRAPLIKTDSEFATATYNDPALSKRVAATFEKALGKEKVVMTEPIMGSEDFGFLGLDHHQIPIFMFWLGSIDEARMRQAGQGGAPLPTTHSPLYYPQPDLTIRTGVKAMTTAVLDLLKK